MSNYRAVMDALEQYDLDEEDAEGMWHDVQCYFGADYANDTNNQTEVTEETLNYAYRLLNFLTYYNV